MTIPPPVVGLVDQNGTPITSLPVSPGTVDVVPQAPFLIYSEASTSRLTNGNTGLQTWIFHVARAFIGVNVTVLSGGASPSVTVFLQQKDGNGILQTIATTAALAAVGAACFSVGPGTPNGHMLVGGGAWQLGWTIAGAPTTCNFQLGVQGR